MLGMLFPQVLWFFNTSKYKCYVQIPKFAYPTTCSCLLNTQKLLNKGHWFSEHVQRVPNSYHNEYLSIDASVLLIVAAAVACSVCSAAYCILVFHILLNICDVYGE
jgi:hypothetical protein